MAYTILFYNASVKVGKRWLAGGHQRQFYPDSRANGKLRAESPHALRQAIR
jgi:hypothetical protein